MHGERLNPENNSARDSPVVHSSVIVNPGSASDSVDERIIGSMGRTQCENDGQSEVSNGQTNLGSEQQKSKRSSRSNQGVKPIWMNDYAS